MKTISRRRRNFLLYLQNPENSDFREEARIFYEESIGRERPYTYYFPDCACAHTRNAIDVVMRGIWVASENAKHEKTNAPKEKSPTDRESPVVVIGG
jgi:hypothetical protein